MDKKDEREESSLHHLNNSWGKIAGVFSALAIISTALVNLFEWEYHIVFAILGGSGLILLIVGLMMDRNAKRQIAHDKEQDAKIEKIYTDMDKRMSKLETITMESYRSAIRSEMNSMMRHYPSEHATIIKYAERYFRTLHANWTETDLFMAWVKREEEAGRPVHVPRDLLKIINESDSHIEEDFLIK